MMTPRSLTMGNKVYKVHVKFGSAKESLSLCPDSSIDQLKQKIHQAFMVAPENQLLICNGKPLSSADNISLKQARIPNGSKIILQKCSIHRSGSPESVEKVYGPSKADFREHSNVKQCSENNGSGQNEGTSAQNATSEVNKNGRQLAALTDIEQRGLEIEQCVKQLGCDIEVLENKSIDVRLCESKRLKRESGIKGELLMKNLEDLDQLSFGEGMPEARASRKRVATLLNRVLDLNDGNIQVLAEIIKKYQV